MKDSVNMQFRVRKGFADEFSEAFAQSDSSNKAEFFRKMFEEYNNPDLDGALEKIIDPLKEELELANQQTESLQGELENCQTQLSFFTSILNPILEKHKGEKVTYKDPKSKKDVDVVIESVEDVFSEIMRSFKISK